jgi:large subunit ribosomal protein L4
MASIELRDAQGKKVGSRDLPADVFESTVSVPLMHQVVTAGLAGIRAGTHSTKTRGDVSGGGKKPWRQKGTGRARQGSIRSPQWRGGGIAHGPKPRDYSQRTPKKMVRAALRSALSDRAAEGRLKVVDSWGIDEPRTKQAITVLETLGLRPAGERAPRVLIVLDRTEHAVWKSFRNLGTRVQIVLPEELNPYDILVNDWIVFSQPTLDSAIERFADKPAAATPKATPAKSEAAAPEAAADEPDADTETDAEATE